MSTTTRNGKPTRCAVAGCSVPVHGRGLCRRHYDDARYRATTGRDPGAAAHAERERWIDAELRLGTVPKWASPHGTSSMFADDDERREAWEARRAQLLQECQRPPNAAGRRPAAWWDYVAKRPQYLLKPSNSQDLRRATKRDHEAEVEKLTWMAANGHLTDDELDQIASEAAQARQRIGTDDEQMAALSPNFGGDKLDVALADAVGRPTRRGTKA